MTPRLSGLMILMLAAVPRFAPRAASTVEAGAAGLETHGGVLRWHGVPFTGVVLDRGADAMPRMQSSYRDGLRDGWTTAWYQGGHLAYRRDYLRGREEGTHRGWWPDGRPQFVYRYRGGRIEGVAREWFEGGALYREARYVAGQESGAQRMWYADGKLRANYEVRSGRRFGLPGAKGCSGLDTAGVNP